MKIDKVTVRYGELRSPGYPAFSNKRIEVELSAVLESGESAEWAKGRLLDHAKRAVDESFAPTPDSQNEMETPF